MRPTPFVTMVAMTILAAATFLPPTAQDARAASECTADEKIDGSSAEAAKKKMEAAGFHQIRDLQKGCDNFWHGTADKDGAPVNVVLSPQGQIMIEGN